VHRPLRSAESLYDLPHHPIDLHCLAVEKMSASAAAKALGVNWDVVNSLALSTVHNLVHSPPDTWTERRSSTVHIVDTLRIGGSGRHFLEINLVDLGAA
jgi:hypothetical protein